MRIIVLLLVGLAVAGGCSGGSTQAGVGKDGGSQSRFDGGGKGDVGTSGSGSGSGRKGDAGGDGSALRVGNTSSAASWFSSSMYFNQPVDTAPVDASSATIISALVANGGWGLTPSRFQIDFSIDVYYADSSAIRVPFDTTGLALPDSDTPATIPIAPGGSAGAPAMGFESGSGWMCDGGDCHYLVVDEANRQLIEAFQANATATSFNANGGSLAVWSFDKAYPGNLRGEVCTSADASGGLMAPLLFTAEEVAAGHIDHAIRFILPNSRIEFKQYVHPATHGTGGSTWAMSNGVPYGARFRLKSTVSTAGLSEGALVVVAALQKYGMFLSDGGSVALTAKSDTFSTTKWDSLLGSQDLVSIQPTDFEMVDGTYGTDHESSTPPVDFTSYTCVRNGF